MTTLPLDQLAMLIKLLKAEGVTRYECPDCVLVFGAQPLQVARTQPTEAHQPLSDAPWLSLTDEDVEQYGRTGRL